MLTGKVSAIFLHLACLAARCGAQREKNRRILSHLGSTRLVTDESGAVVEQFDNLPYGEMCQNSTYPVAVHEKTDYLYTGKELQQFFGIDWYDSFARFQTTSGSPAQASRRFVLSIRERMQRKLRKNWRIIMVRVLK